MARRISSAQLRSKLRQAQAKQKRVIDDFKRAVREHNRRARRAAQELRRLSRY